RPPPRTSRTRCTPIPRWRKPCARPPLSRSAPRCTRPPSPLLGDGRLDLIPGDIVDFDLRPIVPAERRGEFVPVHLRLEFDGEGRRAVDAGAVHVHPRDAGKGLDAI